MPPAESLLPLAALQQIEAAALQLLAAVRQAGAAAVPGSSPHTPSHSQAPVTVAELCNAFLVAKARAGRSDRYVGLLVKELRSFATGREARPAATVSAAEIESWLHGQDWSPRTQRGRLLTVRTLFTWAVARGDLAGNPALGVDLPTVAADPPGIHSPAEVRQVLRTMAGRDPDVCRCLAIRYFAGLRTSEAVALEETEIRLDAGLIEVTAAKAKTRRRRLVTIEPALRAWLDLGGRLPLRQVANRLAAVPRLAGVAWPANVCRHSFCSYHLAQFRSAARTALEAGHSEAMLFAHYRELVTPRAAAEFWGIVP